MNLDQAWGTSGTLHKRLTLESGFETARQGWLTKFNHLQMLSDRVRQLFDKHYLYKCPRHRLYSGLYNTRCPGEMR